MVFPSKADLLDSSASSLDVDINFNKKRILDLAKQLLKHRYFIGTLHEKYYVEKINGYKDVISIDYNERQLIEQLRDFLLHIERFYSEENWWVGITSPGMSGLPHAYCLWVELPPGNVLGKYWFKIRSVRFQKSKELVVSVKIERKIEEYLPTFKTPSEGGYKTFKINNNNEDLFETVKDTFEKGKTQFGKSLRYFFSNVTTPKNIKEAGIFLCLLLVACVTGLFEIFKFLSDFLIKFMYASSHFIKAMIPIVQILVNFVENIFKVFCTLIAYLFKSHPHQQLQQQQRPYQIYRTNSQPKYITYNRQSSRPGVIITELN